MPAFEKSIGASQLSRFFTSADILQLAIIHEAKINYKHSTQDSVVVRKYQHMICSKLFTAFRLLDILAKYNISDYHVSYSSISDSLYCSTIFSSMHQYNSLIADNHDFFPSFPVPSVLKFDRNIQTVQLQLALFDDSNLDSSHKFNNIDLISGISVAFHRGWRTKNNSESAILWLKSLEISIRNDADIAMQRLFWYSDAFKTHFSRNFNKIPHASFDLHLQLHQKWRDWSSIVELMSRNHSLQSMCGMENTLRAVKIRKYGAYIPLPKKLLHFLKQSLSANSRMFKEEMLDIGGKLFAASDIYATCFTHLLSVLAVDPSVVRIGFSRPMRALNKNARSITQSGSIGSEPFSQTGLDGSNMIVGVSDTGIDENSCFFRDAVHGKVNINHK